MESLNQILPRLIGQLQGKNPKAFGAVSELMKNGGNPDAYMKQMLGQMSPDAKQRLLNQAKSCGCPDSFLSKLQNG